MRKGWVVEPVLFVFTGFGIVLLHNSFLPYFPFFPVAIAMPVKFALKKEKCHQNF